MLGVLCSFVPFLAGFGFSTSLLRPVIPECDFLIAVNHLARSLQALEHVPKEFRIIKLRHAAAPLRVICQDEAQD
jgi:hypothetical protein